MDMMNELRYEIMQANNDSTYEVLNAMAVAYDKIALIAESYNGDNLDCFAIIQEAGVSDEYKKMTKGKSELNKFLFFIPRIVVAMFKALGDAISKSKPIEVISDNLPSITIEKAKKDPNIFVKILKSKPVKTISIVGSGITAGKFINQTKDLFDQYKNIKKDSATIQELINVRQAYTNATILCEFNTKQGKDKDGNTKYVAVLRSTLSDIDKLIDACDNYLINIISNIKSYSKIIKSATSMNDVAYKMNQLYKDILTESINFKSIVISDEIPEDAKWYKFSEFSKGLKDAQTKLKDVITQKQKFQDALEEVLKAIPVDKFENEKPSSNAKIAYNKFKNEYIKGQIKPDEPESKKNAQENFNNQEMIQSYFSSTVGNITNIIINDIKDMMKLTSNVNAELKTIYTSFKTYGTFDRKSSENNETDKTDDNDDKSSGNKKENNGDK